jgi:hypothetical protein
MKHFCSLKAGINLCGGKEHSLKKSVEEVYKVKKTKKVFLFTGILYTVVSDIKSQELYKNPSFTL